MDNVQRNLPRFTMGPLYLLQIGGDGGGVGNVEK